MNQYAKKGAINLRPGELIIKEGYCYSFAKENNLMPTEEEILAEIANRRAIVESRADWI